MIASVYQNINSTSPNAINNASAYSASLTADAYAALANGTDEKTIEASVNAF